MTDNEKRAHDIAIASIPILFELHNSQLRANPDMDPGFDVYWNYKAAYEHLIPLVNRDF